MRAAPWYSLRRVVRRGDHQGRERADGLLWGVFDLRIAVRASRPLSNQASKEALVGRAGGGASDNAFRSGEIVAQSDLVQSSPKAGGA